MNAIEEADFRRDLNENRPCLARRVRAFIVLVAVFCACAWGAQAAPPQRVEGRLLVKAKPGVSEAAVQALLTAHGAQQKSAIKQIGVRIVEVPPGNQDGILDALKHNAQIAFAEPDYLLGPEAFPNDTYYALEWHLPKIAAPTAWNTTLGSSNIVIAILDSGVDSSHPDLAGQLVPGWNFCDDNDDTSDVMGHGTGVAGNAVALGNNGVGVASVAWGCKVMPIRVTDTNGYASTSMIAQGVTYAADHGARVANASFRITGTLALSTAAQYFQSKGGVVTTSAGNDGMVQTLPDDPYMLTVSATDSSDAVASFSNTGSNVDLSAPGVNIATTIKGGGYGYATGTSASAPLVAGIAALVLSVNPDLTGAQVQDILKKSADDLGAPGWDPGYGWGRVNAYNAVQLALITPGDGTNAAPDTTAPTAIITAPLDGGTVSGLVTITVTATDDVGVTRVEYLINGALAATNASAPAAFTWDTMGSANGSYTLEARAYDAAGNMGSSGLITVTVQNAPPDTISPTAKINSPADGTTVSGIVGVAITATDNVGVVRVEWYLNGASAGTTLNPTANFPWDTTKYPNGSCTLEARAYDAAGNMGSSGSLTVSVQNGVADVTAPTVAITSPSDSSSVAGLVTVNVTAADNIGVTRVEWYLNGACAGTNLSASAAFTWDTTGLANGSYVLQARAYDAAGNVGISASVTVSVQNPLPDLTPPTVQITAPTSGTVLSSKTTKVYVTATDNLGVTRVDLLVDGKYYSTSSSATPVFAWYTGAKLSRGSHTLQAVAYDAAGNSTRSAGVTVTK